jgi:hypothetical protein
MISKQVMLLAVAAAAFGINGVNPATAQVYPSHPMLRNRNGKL